MPLPRAGEPVDGPSVTAVVTAHDRRTYLAEAVASALNAGVDEVVVVRNFAGPIEGVEGRYRDIPCAEDETGAKEAVGLSSAQSDVVAFLDDDDVWDVAKVPHVRELFASDPTLDYYCHAQLPVDSSGHPVTARHREWARKDPKRLASWNRRDFRTLFQEIWPGNNSSTVVRRSWALDWAPALREAGWGADSFWLTAALLSAPRWHLDGARLTRLRLHDVNMSQTRGATREEFFHRAAQTSVRFARSWRVLSRIASERTGASAPLAKYLRGRAAGSEFLAHLEAGAASRAGAIHVLGLGPGNLDRSVLGTAWTAAVSPGLARRLLYWSGQRRWKLE